MSETSGGPRIWVAVVHDRRRADRLERLLEAIVGEGLFEAAYVADEGSGIGPWVGMVEAIGMAPRDGSVTHILLLEDDAEPRDGFCDLVRQIAERQPDDVVHLGATEQQAGDPMYKALETGQAFALVHDRPIGAVAVLMPLHRAHAFVRWARTAEVDAAFRAEYPEDKEAGDLRLWKFLTGVCGVAQIVTSASLVEHGCAEPDESIAPHPRREGSRTMFMAHANWPRPLHPRIDPRLTGAVGLVAAMGV